MKSLGLIVFLFSGALASDNLVDTCIKNSVISKKEIRKICQCGVDKTLTHIKSNNYKDKDPTKRIKWYKDYLDLKLSQSEIDEDKYSILEFEYYFAKECVAQYK